MHSPAVPAGDADVGSVVVAVGVDTVGAVVAIGNIITHTTWLGSELHLPSSLHTELGGDGVNPDC